MAEVLFVDDEQSILAALKRAFRGFENYEYHFAASPLEALEVMSQHSITVLVSDHKMPQMTGAEFLARVKEKRPDTVRIFLTGQADLEAVQKAVNSGEIYRFFVKPWKDDELRTAVRQAVEFHGLTTENRRLQELTKSQNEELTKLNDQLDHQIQLRTKQLADALFTARSLNEQLAQGMHAGTKALFSMIQLARPELGSHSRRVADHCLAVGEALGYKGEELRQLEIAALLHDSGKLGLPPFIVEKHISDYCKEEHDLYRTHPFIGSEYLKGVPQYEQVCEIILDHHERSDGSGFPRNLKGGQITSEALLIGILDEYDHLVNRPQHNQEFNYQYTCQHLAEYADRQYPGRIVQAVLDYAARVNDRLLSSDEMRISLVELSPNLMLARDVYSMSGSLLLAAGATLTAQSIARLRAIAKLDPLAGEIAVFKKDRRHATQAVN
ncbi:MAG: HD domain-containing phosphohydrolase [Candidatus Zixiibacteriota bacterium]